jgi:anti-sigma B factor antagonist
MSLVSSDGDLRCVACAGDMTLLDLREGADPLEELLGANCFSLSVLLDLEKATYMDTAVVGWLIQCLKHFREQGGRMVLHSVPPLIDELFQFLKLSAILPVAADGAAARKMVRG